jgi:hypothetical protein
MDSYALLSPPCRQIGMPRHQEMAEVLLKEL